MANAVSTSPDLALSHLDSLPTLPPVAVKLLHVTTIDESNARDVVELLRGDQSLTAKILSVANSAAAGVRGSVTTLEKAVPLLGFARIRCIVLATSVFECFGRQGHAGGLGLFDPMDFWKHALAVACAARRLARSRPDTALDPEEAFVAGLLHDLGKVALGTMFPKAYDRIAIQANQSRGDISDAERAILGADHTVAGRRLAEHWRLPQHLQDVIWLHHLAADALPSSVASPKLIGAVQLADTIAREQHLGYSGNYVFYEHSPRLAGRLGFTADHVASAVDALLSDVAEHAALLGLDDETPEALYVKAMRHANTELGRLNTDLLAGNRRLAAGARYFKAITEFERQLSDWADPAAVVTAVAAAAASALQQPRVFAFGLRDDARTVDVSWAGPAAEIASNVTQGAPPDLRSSLDEARQRADAVIGPAPPTVCSLLGSAIGPEDRGTPWLLPIRHEGDITGGIVYTSDGDERNRLADETQELRSFLTSLGLALGRANAQAAARRLSEDLAETNRRLQQMQVELLRSRTLAMIAEMAAGAGHELNTPLSVISGRAQMLVPSIDDPEAKRVLETICAKAHECSGIVTELMDFARPQSPQLDTVNLNEVLTEARDEWLERSGMAASRLRLRSRSADSPASQTHQAALVLADREQLKTVFLELISNAADAIASTDGAIELRYQPTLQEDTLEVLVTDSGCGMTPAVLQRSFDPFYSHRHAGRGRGLGLPRAYRIIEAHGGRIWLESHPDEGTTAHVLLPRAPSAAS